MNNLTVEYLCSTVEVAVTHYHRQEPDRRADNPNDFHGYTEVEFSVTDNPAELCEEDLESSEFEAAVIEAFEDNLEALQEDLAIAKYEALHQDRYQ
ncbi:hypothetical protein N9112_00285 [bacterium]|nr:hypothetical protein [bacterium]